MNPSYQVKVLVQDAEGVLSEKTVGTKGRTLSRRAARRVAHRLTKAGFAVSLSA